jgi:hypothetical protein
MRYFSPLRRCACDAGWPNFEALERRISLWQDWCDEQIIGQ